MKTINYNYLNNNELENFINKNDKFKANQLLLQIFTGVCSIQFIREIINIIKKKLPHIKIIGATTSGEIIGDSVQNNSTVFSFTIFEATKIITYYTENKEHSYETAQNLIKQFDKTNKATLAISFTDGLNTNGETYLNAFHNYDNNLIVAGGLAGDNRTFTQTIVFTENKILTNGAVVALLYNDNLKVTTEVNFGWKNLGKKLKITKVKENIVYEIDNIPAVDIYKKYLGKHVVEDIPASIVEFPLIIQRDGVNIARAVVGQQEDKSLFFAGNINLNDEVTFGYANIKSMLKDGNNSYTKFSNLNVESIFIYSCMARKIFIGDEISLELKPLNKITELSGFFTYGEFFSDTKINENKLLNQTMTILALSENTETIPPKKNDNQIITNKSSQYRTLEALTHLLTQTTSELEEIHNSLEKRIQEEVQKNREKDKKLFQQTRFAQMGEMIDLIAHQWLQPIHLIKLKTSFIDNKNQNGHLTKEKIEEFTNNLTIQTNHIIKTLHEFRSFFKNENKISRVSYKKLIDGVLLLLKDRIKNEIEIILDFNHNIKVNVIENEFKHILINIINNAIDSFNKKSIKNKKFIFNITELDGFISLNIIDNAGGIPNNIIEHIFEPYFTTKEEGSGVGLYFSSMIIEKIGGKLLVENHNNGVKFNILVKK